MLALRVMVSNVVVLLVLVVVVSVLCTFVAGSKMMTKKEYEKIRKAALAEYEKETKK